MGGEITGKSMGAVEHKDGTWEGGGTGNMGCHDLQRTIMKDNAST